MLITRTIFINTVKAFQTKLVNGKPEVQEFNPFEFYTTVAPKQKDIDSAVEEKLGNIPNLLTNVESKQEVRGIEMDDFMAHSVLVNRPQSQIKK